MSSDEALESLAIAGHMAPRMRGAPEKVRKRRVALRDKDDNVTGYSTWEEVQKALLKRRHIEFDVADGVRPKEAMCQKCGLPFKMSERGPISKTCAGCRRGSCADCGGALSKVASYKGTRRCRKCVSANAICAKTCKDCGKKINPTVSRVKRCRSCAGKRRWQNVLGPSGAACSKCGRQMLQSEIKRKRRTCKCCCAKKAAP